MNAVAEAVAMQVSGLTHHHDVKMVLDHVDLALQPGSIPTRAIDVLTLGWLAFGALLYWLGLRSWRGLQRRPHPFLANALQ